MKRKIIYPGAIPLETDLLDTNKDTMIALGKVIAAVFGTATFVNGLACTPTAPASLNVVISPGEIYSLQNVDGTAYSSIAADTAHQIMKQGIQMDAVQLACAAPATAGNSINYLIQAAFSEVDGNAVVLPYYNASNPAQAYSGPNNSGTTNNTSREGKVVLQAKAGISAATGSQVTPTPDAGYTGLWVVTVANGQASIVAGNIAAYASAPFSGSLLNYVQQSAIGVGQSWQNLVASRTPNTTYTNTTGRSIMVSVGMITDVAQGTAVLFVNGVGLAGSSNYVTGTPMSLVTAIIPPGATYLAKMANGNTTLQSWAELR